MKYLPVICGLLLAVFGGELPAATEAPGGVPLKVAPGFVAETVFTGGPEDGSWSAMTIDPQGRVIISPQESEPMLRITPAAEGKPMRVEKLKVPVTSAMGLLCAFDSLYVNGTGPQGFGLYRLRETNGSAGFEEVKLLRQFDGEVAKEHGSHGLALGPDGRIYLAQGNHVTPPADARPDSPYRNGAEDQLLPSATYGLSSGDRAPAPCGHILSMDAEGQDVEMFAGGFRNIYDLAFDARGELFAFDSDTEYNWGLPWYVPTRILHVVRGGEYGFREGSGKWPAYYPDSLPPVVPVGLGSPTGVKFGTSSRFPEPYRRALFALDWTFGRILAVHLEPRGASFSGRCETFVQGRPLNLTGLGFGPDGAMYFITGGRRTRSALYRVRALREETAAQAPEAALPAAKIADAVSEKDPLNRIWRELGDEDRWVRFAARIRLEALPAEPWSARALAEPNSRAALTALLALARIGTPADRAAVVARVAFWWPQCREESAQLEALRVAEVALARSGQPYPATKEELGRALDPAFPAESPKVNRELAQVLLALEVPGAVRRTMALVQASETFEDQLGYILPLRTVRAGWSAADREAYFRWFTRPHPAAEHAPEMRHWFADVRLHYADGASLLTYLRNIRTEASRTLSDAERAALEPWLSRPIVPDLPPVAIQPHAFVKAWTTDELVPLVEGLTGSRSPERGREVFAAASCILCHSYANEGGAVGPDLNAVAYKLGATEFVESIIEPSKTIADQYQNSIVELADGDMRVGRVVKKGKDKLVLSANPLTGDREEIATSRIRSVKPSPVSPMPPGLLNQFTQEEILDLLAYLGFGEP